MGRFIKTDLLLSSDPFDGSCGSCRPLLLFMGVPVGLVWTDPLRGCALSHIHNHQITAEHDLFVSVYAFSVIKSGDADYSTYSCVSPDY